DSSKVFLVYSGNKFVKSDSVLIKATEIPGNFSAKISMGKTTELNYYFSASDIKGRRFVFPSNAPVRYLTFKIGIDKEAPVVKHEPVKYMITTNLSAKIDAEVTDNIGIKTVKIEYFINGGAIKEIPLLNDTNDIYTGNLVLPSGTVKDGDKISYRIVAVDSSSQSNIGRSPISGYYIFYIQGIKDPIDKYVNNFDTEINDFIGSDFTVATVTGFDSKALNSAHPYPSPDTDDMNFNFVATLKYPIILKAGGKMSFDEIVLVEPGETGIKFGNDEFWDYVIVEGSKDGGSSWKPLIDGYDSNAQSSWLTLYNSSMSGQNSTAVPNKNLFVKRVFELLANGNFQAGDTIQIRFRLYSDPYAHGWGWIIDNLSIQDFGTDVNSLEISSGEVVFYPNPASDFLNIELQAKNTIEKLVLKAFNSSGKIVYNQQFAVGSNNFQTTIDVSNYSPGLYLFTLNSDGGKVITRKILVR
ncbi:MAG: T9SS type A sorting domain-containing protein, partial [Bacteroidota bacterium]|nr:T9SS type A sorting domain-containing protein [Bacteroidota bacterium]